MNIPHELKCGRCSHAYRVHLMTTYCSIGRRKRSILGTCSCPEFVYPPGEKEETVSHERSIRELEGRIATMSEEVGKLQKELRDLKNTPEINQDPLHG